MELSSDELAGVVDLFGALTREELGRALVELAFKHGEDCDPDDFAADIADAVESYHLVTVDFSDAADASTLVVPGPVAFPELPEHATDLPHILGIETRSLDREKLGEAAEQQFRADTARAVDADDEQRIAELLDVSYELDVWAPVDLSGARERLDNA
jgi:hypothetical protein